jgi:hypothetical protein
MSQMVHMVHMVQMHVGQPRWPKSLKIKMWSMWFKYSLTGPHPLGGRSNTRSRTQQPKYP